MGASGRLITEAEQRAAIDSLARMVQAGTITERQRAAYAAAVWRANTRHELHRHTGGLLGDPHRRDAGDWGRAVAVWVGVAIGMAAVTWFVALAARDGLLG